MGLVWDGTEGPKPTQPRPSHLCPAGEVAGELLRLLASPRIQAFGGRFWIGGLTTIWVAVKELNLSYHIKDLRIYDK